MKINNDIGCNAKQDKTGKLNDIEFEISISNGQAPRCIVYFYLTREEIARIHNEYPVKEVEG